MPAPIAPRPAKPMRSMSLNSPPRQLSMRRAVQHSRREPERTRSGAVERTGLKMADDATQIRTLIERWADAVHGGDMDHVLADHADDIVMFDVPPPYDPRTACGLRSDCGSRAADGVSPTSIIR